MHIYFSFWKSMQGEHLEGLNIKCPTFHIHNAYIKFVSTIGIVDKVINQVLTYNKNLHA